MKSCTPVFLHSFMVGSMLGHAYPKNNIIMYFLCFMSFLYVEAAAAATQSEKQQAAPPSH